MSSDTSLDARKTELRREARAVRAGLTAQMRLEAGQRVAAVGLGFLALPPGIASGYFPVRTEFDCLPLMARLEAEGWRLALPVAHKNAPLEFRAWDYGTPLSPGAHNIMEPPPGPAVTPNVLLVPLLAFDARGTRLGYGGGHFDRTLAALRRDQTSVAVGIAFDEQEIPEIPVGPYDEPLNWILTPSGPRAMHTQREPHKR